MRKVLGAARAQIQNKVQENTRLRAQGERAEAAEQQQAVPVQPTYDPIPEQDMPAPSSSALSAPTGDGFQTVPDTCSQTDFQGGQP